MHRADRRHHLPTVYAVTIALREHSSPTRQAARWHDESAKSIGKDCWPDIRRSAPGAKLRFFPLST